MNNKDKILVGQFSAPVGLKGEIKVNFMTSTFEVFRGLDSYFNFDKSVIWDFKKISFNNNKCVVHPKKCNSRETALILKGEKIYSYKSNFPTTKNNEFFISDLIGCNLINKDKSKIGMVLDVKNFGAGDLLEVQSDKKTILIPFNNTNIISVDVDIKEIIADPIKGIIE